MREKVAREEAPAARGHEKILPRAPADGRFIADRLLGRGVRRGGNLRAIAEDAAMLRQSSAHCWRARYVVAVSQSADGRVGHPGNVAERPTAERQLTCVAVPMAPPSLGYSGSLRLTMMDGS